MISIAIIIGFLLAVRLCINDLYQSGSAQGTVDTALLAANNTWTGTNTFAPSTTTGGATSLTLTAPTRTAIPTTAECTELLITLGTQTWATGTVATQRFIHITAPTIAFAGASTATLASTVTIDGAPAQGTNATITTAWALNVVAGGVNLGGAVTHGGATTLNGVVTLAPSVTTGGTTSWTLTAPTRSAIPTTAECTESLITLGTQTWAAGTVATQRFIHITAPTVAFASASTMTSTATLTIDGAPIQGTNATLTTAYALNVVAGLVNIGGTLTVAGVITSTQATGTAPFTVASTTQVANLNVSQLVGATWTAPGTIGSGTPNTGAFTTISATGQITSTLAGGTAPFVVASSTVVANLNVSQLLGQTWANPGAIGGTTPATTVALSGILTSTNTTSATTSLLGAVVIGNGTAATSIGMGAGNINAGGSITANGTTNSTTSTSGTVVIGNGVAATSVGIGGGNLYVGSGISAANGVTVSAGNIGVSSGTITATAASGVIGSFNASGGNCVLLINGSSGNTGILRLGAGGTNLYQINGAAASMAFADSVNSAWNWMVYTANTQALATVTFAGTLDASSSTVAANVMSGGLAVAKQIRCGGAMTVTGNFACNGVATSAQPTGYGTPTGGALVSSFAAGSITDAQVAAELAQLIIDLKKSGIIGA